MEHEYINNLQKGFFFPSSSSASLCLTKTKPISKTQIERLKKEILSYLKKHDGAYITDIAKELKTDPKKIILVIKELKNEGLLV